MDPHLAVPGLKAQQIDARRQGAHVGVSRGAGLPLP